MKEKKKQNKPKQNPISLLIPMLFGGFIGFGTVMFSETQGIDFISTLIIFLAFTLLAMLINILIHEAGHLVFGLLSGYSFVSFRIFSLTVIKKETGIRFALLSIPGTAGQCLMSPPELRDGKMPVVLYNLGGCIMNLIFTALFVLLSLLALSAPIAALFFLTNALISLMFALLNGIPLNSSSVPNDGHNALTLRRDSALMQAMWVQMKVAEQSAMGLRLGEMPEDWFVLSDNLYSTTLGSSVAFFAAERMMDQRRFSEAEEIFSRLADLSSGTVGVYRALVASERCYIEIIGECRKDVVDSLVSDTDKKLLSALRNELAVIRTDYARALLLDRNSELADRIEKRFNSRAAKAPYPQDAASEGELLMLVRERFCSLTEA